MEGNSPRNLLRSTLFLLGVAAWLYSATFVFPCTPIFEGDVSPIFLQEAVRMLHGQVIYKDFPDVVFPGVQHVYMLLMEIFGVKSWIANLMLVVLGTSLAGLGVSISRRVLKGKLVYLPSALFLGFAFTSEPDPTHHWYSTLAVMTALAVIIPERKPWRIALTGALCGVAMVFTQTVGPAAAFGVSLYLVWEFRQRGHNLQRLVKNLAGLWASFVAAVAALIAYPISQSGFSAFYSSTIQFPATYWRQWFWNTSSVYLYEVPNLEGPVEIGAVGLWLSIHVLLPAVYLVFLARWLRLRKSEPGEPWDRLMLLSFVGLCLFISVVPSPSWLRLCSISFPGLIVLVWLARSSNMASTVFRRMLWGAGALALAAQPLIAQTNWHGYLTTPAGREVFATPDVYDKFKWLAEHTRPGEDVFQAADCSVYYLLKLNDPAPVMGFFLTASDYTQPGEVQKAISSLEQRRVKYVLWSVWLDLPFPDRPGPFDAARLAPLREYLRTHYRLVRNFGEPDYEQVWERIP